MGQHFGLPSKGAVYFKVLFFFRSFQNAFAYAKRLYVTEMVDTFNTSIAKEMLFRN